MQQWWKRTVFYQIYMPSFCDGNHDGIGDFVGITSKLPYLKRLGVGGIWLTPFYASPKVDQGYDISDYYRIDPDYGSMEDFEIFIEKAHSLGIKVIVDMVINHTSTEHQWFRESQSAVSNSKRDWYIWKKPKEGKEPNNWESFFGEKAWEYDEQTQMYYYHSFAKEQVDLNWANPQVKQAVFEMLDFWVKKGIDGFRLDVINNLTLTDCMKDNPYDEEGKQIHKYDVNQEGIHDFIRELKQHLGKELFLVGEISSDNLDIIHSYVGDGQLDTTFNFNLGSIEQFDFPTLYEQIRRMTQMYTEDNYPTIFFGSHDMARFPSRFQFNENQTKNLFTLMMCYRGIPFIYFGDEIGMKNYRCQSIEDARDIQGVIAYRQALEAGAEEAEAVKRLDGASRDHSRNTMYWDDSAYGGFSDVRPWINYQQQSGKSAKNQMEDEKSLFSYVSKLNENRSQIEELMSGNCIVDSPKEGIIICKRKTQSTQICVMINFSEENYELELEEEIETVQILMETNENAAYQEQGKLIIKAENSVMWR